MSHDVAVVLSVACELVKERPGLPWGTRHLFSSAPRKFGRLRSDLDCFWMHLPKPANKAQSTDMWLLTFTVMCGFAAVCKKIYGDTRPTSQPLFSIDINTLNDKGHCRSSELIFYAPYLTVSYSKILAL